MAGSRGRASQLPDRARTHRGLRCGGGGRIPGCPPASDAHPANSMVRELPGNRDRSRSAPPHRRPALRGVVASLSADRTANLVDSGQHRTRSFARRVAADGGDLSAAARASTSRPSCLAGRSASPPRPVTGRKFTSPIRGLAAGVLSLSATRLSTAAMGGAFLESSCSPSSCAKRPRSTRR